MKNVGKAEEKRADEVVREKVEEAMQMNSLELDISGLGLQIIPPSLRSYHMNWRSIEMSFNK